MSVTVLLTTVATAADGGRYLAALLSKQRVNDEDGWTPPSGRAEAGATPADVAVAVVDEVLNVMLDAAALEDRAQYARIHITRGTSAGSTVYVARHPLPEDAHIATDGIVRVAVHDLLDRKTIKSGNVYDLDGAPVAPLHLDFTALLDAHKPWRAIAKALAGHSGPVAPPGESVAQLQRAQQAHAARVGADQKAAEDISRERYHEVARRGAFRLLVGDFRAASDPHVLAREGVTHVVNCAISDFTDSPRSWAPFAPAVKYRFVYSDDHSDNLADEDPSDQWPAVMSFLAQCEAEGGTALVHCWAGVNRSVTTAAVYMTVAGMAPSVLEGVQTIKSRRPQARPYEIYVRFGESFIASSATAPT